MIERMAVTILLVTREHIDLLRVASAACLRGPLSTR
jgi:hypothetical protein